LTNENKYPPIHALASWLSYATPQMKQLLASLANSSECMFRQWTAGRRGMSAGKAGELAAASAKVKQVIPNAPVPLKRGDLCEACRTCEYYNQVENFDNSCNKSTLTQNISEREAILAIENIQLKQQLAQQAEELASLKNTATYFAQQLKQVFNSVN